MREEQVRIGDCVCGTLGGLVVGALFAGAIGVALTGSPLDWVPAPACFADFGSTVSRLLYASYYSCAGGVAFVLVRVFQELLRGRRWRDAILEARRMPSIW